MTQEKKKTISEVITPTERTYLDKLQAQLRAVMPSYCTFTTPTVYPGNALEVWKRLAVLKCSKRQFVVAFIRLNEGYIGKHSGGEVLTKPLKWADARLAVELIQAMGTIMDRCQQRLSEQTRTQ